MQEAIIILLPKPGKDPLFPKSYRPISLLLVDAKILAKVLTARLTQVIPNLIDSDQTGFIPEKSTAINFRCLYLNLQLPSDCQGSWVVCSLDPDKAFDIVEWEFLWPALEKMQFWPNFLSWVKLFYTSSRACLRINGSTS